MHKVHVKGVSQWEAAQASSSEPQALRHSGFRVLGFKVVRLEFRVPGC